MKKYPLKTDDATAKNGVLELGYDVGYASIGWAVLDAEGVIGAGAVTFPPDDCLASQRRVFRRQRRHIRATRMRIARLKRVLAHLGVPGDLDAVSTASPWYHAARVLASGGRERLTWPLLWDVIRWYAHNRGYDGNKGWSRLEGEEMETEAEKEDTEKVKNALGLYEKFGTSTMAETWCALCGLKPLENKKSANPEGERRPKGQNAAFPREDVEREVARILQAHEGVLPGLSAEAIEAVLHDWKKVVPPDVRLPDRYAGGWLFGQLRPRFDNRIVARCPLTYEKECQAALEEGRDEEEARRQAEKLSKVPAASCAEYLLYRWTMQVANVQVTAKGGGLRRLSAAERRAVYEQARERGGLTKGEFKKAVRALTGGAADNLDQMLQHPEAERALVLDPARRVLAAGDLAAVFLALSESRQRQVANELRRGRRLRVSEVRQRLDQAEAAEFDRAVEELVGVSETKRSKKQAGLTREEVLARAWEMRPVTGRAPHSRALMREVADFVLSTDGHPAEQGGPLYWSEAVRQTQQRRALDEQTNNHLVRHRLKILDRLHEDILARYAGADGERITRITIEVNSDLRAYSGMLKKEIEADIGRRLASHKAASAKLEKDLAGTGIPITPGLIRKARIAQDQGWTCPYTGKPFDAVQLARRAVDKDHIIPRSVRPSDSLDSLVITFNEVNRLKGKRTARRFVAEDQGKVVPGLPQVAIKTLDAYERDVKKLRASHSHDDDKRRVRNRQRLLLLDDYVEKEFTPRDLTQTSQLVRLAAQSIRRRHEQQKKQPVVVSLPGSVTGSVRKGWKVLGCLGAANAQVTEQTTKTEVRGITHLHHALDAAVLALAARHLPRDGGAWELLTKRKWNAAEQGRARDLFGDRVKVGVQGDYLLADLPRSQKEKLRQALAERRVVRHVPSDMSGMRAELNAWRVVEVSEDGYATLRQSMRQADGTIAIKPDRKERVDKLVGLADGKLKKLKAALIIADNYGLALDPEPCVIPFHKVWQRLADLRAKNGGRTVRVLRNGQLIRLTEGKNQGVWRVFSIKNASVGILLDLGRPDVVKLQNKTPGHWINAGLGNLLKNGMQILECSFEGSSEID